MRLRILFLGATVLGWLGPAIFTWRKAKEGQRILYLLLAVISARIAYLPCLEGGLLFASWVERLGRALGGGARIGFVVHYSLGCSVAALSCFVAFVVISATAHAKKPASIAVFVLLGLGALLAFSHPDDRAPLPQALRGEDGQPAAGGDDYLDIAEEGRRPARTRVLAALLGITDALAPRTGWADAVHREMHARFRADPDMSFRARVTSIEGALRTARPLFRTSPRTPPA
ncbi:MAG TPA: hypothetical protein VFY93_00140 [Planctomycetota bacterium]|nr:hypothetical protein [Planctomycetota bacterium]